MHTLQYKDGHIFEIERMTYKLEGKYNVLRPSGKLVARFKIKNLFSLRGKKTSCNRKSKNRKNER